jgi:hypothetical protein
MVQKLRSKIKSKKEIKNEFFEMEEIKKNKKEEDKKKSETEEIKEEDKKKSKTEEIKEKVLKKSTSFNKEKKNIIEEKTEEKKEKKLKKSISFYKDKKNSYEKESFIEEKMEKTINEKIKEKKIKKRKKSITEFISEKFGSFGIKDDKKKEIIITEKKKDSFENDKKKDSFENTSSDEEQDISPDKKRKRSLINILNQIDYNEFSNYNDLSKHLINNERIIIKSNVIKIRRFSCKMRILILTDFPRLFYVSPKSNNFKGIIPWSDNIHIEKKKQNSFNIITRKRIYCFDESERTSDEWIDSFDMIK